MLKLWGQFGWGESSLLLLELSLLHQRGTERIQSQEKEGALELCSFSFLTWAKSSSITIEKQKGGEMIAMGSEERTAAEQLGAA